MHPFEALYGRPPRAGEPHSPSRAEALLQAFALEAALRERDTQTLTLSLAAAFKKR